MSARWRLFLTAVLLIVVPAGLLAGFFRDRLIRQVRDQVCRDLHRELTRTVDSPLRAAADNGETLIRLASAAVEDNQLRLALVGGRDDLLPTLRDHAGQIGLTTPLDVLQLMDADGRILSSAHYRNEFGRLEPDLLTALAASDFSPQRRWSDREWLQLHGDVAAEPDPGNQVSVFRSAFAIEQTPQGRFLALLTRQDFTLGGQTFSWVGGVRADSIEGFDEAITIVTADTSLLATVPGRGFDPKDPASITAWGQRTDHFWETRDVPVILAGQSRPGLLLAHRSGRSLHQQLARIDTLVAATLLSALAGAFVLAIVVSSRLARPLADLAGRANQVDLDHPASDFVTDRHDEVGQLARVLDAMVTRLRESARGLAEAERRATLGELSRQVNHDLRNGITPVRNILRHLSETASRSPDQLAAVFQSRLPTLDTSLGYLEDLATRYARLAPHSHREACDLATIARETTSASADDIEVVDHGAPQVMADPVSMRRIIDNLVRNAREAAMSGNTRIAVTVSHHDDPDLGRQALLVVRDHGIGMPPEVLDRVFEDFFTTKDGGTGLGLSNVRRLAGDAGGRLEIESTPGAGTTVTITFPAAETDA